jgi:hypothetical protein
MATKIDQKNLPEAITTYLDARASTEPSDPIAVFADDARVTDEDKSYVGRPAIAEWIHRSSTEYEFTTTFLSAEQDGRDYIVTNRLDGNFPGNTIDLRNRFTLHPANGLIVSLTIAP